MMIQDQLCCHRRFSSIFNSRDFRLLVSISFVEAESNCGFKTSYLTNILSFKGILFPPGIRQNKKEKL